MTTTYLCTKGSCVETWGSIIPTANAAIEKALESAKQAHLLQRLRVHDEYHGEQGSL